MATIPIDAILNSTLYANTRIDKYAYPGGPSIGKIDRGGIIGTIYSYALLDGKVYWMIDDIYGSQTFFVKHDPYDLNLPNKNAILNDLARKAEAQKLQDKGIVQYNIDKYLPYIIGAGVLALAAPSIITAISNKKISGMEKKKNNKKTVLFFAAGAAALYFLTRKKRKAGTPIIESIDEGFVNEVQSTGQPASTITPESVSVTPVTIVDSFGNTNTIPAIQPIEAVPNTGSGGGGYIEYLGPFKAVYDTQQNMVAGVRRKGNIGRVKTC